jgi:DNA-binding CsgD family transcriptional regulator
MKRFFIELWGVVYCPIKELQFNFKDPPSDAFYSNMVKLMRRCMEQGYECRFCITLPDTSRNARIGVQNEIAAVVGKDYDDWLPSFYSALALFSALSPMEQKICLLYPGMEYKEIADRLGYEPPQVKKSLERIRKKLMCDKKNEITWLLIRTGFYHPLSLQTKLDFAVH